MDNSAKMAIFNQTQYGAAQAYLNKQKTNGALTQKTNFTLPNGRVLVRNVQSNRIDFKTLFAGLNSDTVDNTTAINNFKKVSDNMASSYSKRTKSYLNKSINS